MSVIPRYVSFSLRTLSLERQLMSKLLRKSAILLMEPVISSMYSLLTQSACRKILNIIVIALVSSHRYNTSLKIITPSTSYVRIIKI